MVQTVVIPLSELNQIPAVGGIDDVRFTIPDVEDIVQAIDETLPDQDDVEEAVGNVIGEGIELGDDAVDELVDAISEGIEETGVSVNIATEAVENIVDQVVNGVVEEIGTLEDISEEIAAAVAENVDLSDLAGDTVNVSGVFGPLREDVVQALEQTLGDVDEALDDFGDDVTTLADGISEALDRLPEAGVPGVDEFEDVVVAALGDAEPVVDENGLFSDPVGFVQAVLDDIADGFVSDEAVQELEDALEDIA